MKYLLILLLTVSLASCFKYINVDNSIKYTVTGFHDLVIDQNDSGTLSINIQLLSGDPTNEYITATVTGLPDSISVNPDSLTFRPNYYYQLVFHGHSPKAGVYPVSVKMVSPTMGTKIYTFNLTVTSLVDCTMQIVASPYPYPTSTRHQAIITGGAPGNLYAYLWRKGCDTIGIRVMKDSVELAGSDPITHVLLECYAFINCANNTLNLYPQTTRWLEGQNEVIKGSGAFAPVTATSGTITINDTVYLGSQVDNVNTITIY